MIPSIIDADRKIFMTATLADDSILSSHFGIDDDHINALLFLTQLVMLVTE